MGYAYHDVIAMMLICILTIVIVVGIIFTCLIRRWRRLRGLNIVTGPNCYIRIFSRNSQSASLRRPSAWLAIRNPDVRMVQAALAINDAEPCPISEGLVANNEQKLFVSPPIAGWILVVGPSLPDPSDDVDVTYRFITSLSSKLGQVQYFKVNPALNHHAWVRAEFGQILRGYAWAGKTLWNEGEMSAAERELRLRCYEYCEGPDFSMFDLMDPTHGNSEKIHQLAARWSINPENIDERFVEHRLGVVGHSEKLL